MTEPTLGQLRAAGVELQVARLRAEFEAKLSPEARMVWDMCQPSASPEGARAMTNLPHVLAAGAATEEHIRVVEAYCREYDLPYPGVNPRADVVNAAVDWWNALGTETGEEETT